MLENPTHRGRLETIRTESNEAFANGFTAYTLFVTDEPIQAIVFLVIPCMMALPSTLVSCVSTGGLPSDGDEEEPSKEDEDPAPANSARTGVNGEREFSLNGRTSDFSPNGRAWRT